MTSDKLHAKSDKCFFVGYPRETKWYYFYNREEGKVFVVRNGVFLEKEFFKKRSRNNVQLEEFDMYPKEFRNLLDHSRICKMLQNPRSVHQPDKGRAGLVELQRGIC